MDGYTREAIRQRIIKSGGDPDAPPSRIEILVMKYVMPIASFVFIAGFSFVIYSAFKNLN